MEKGQAAAGIFEVLDFFDHIVFDEFHSIEARGFGLAALCARLVTAENPDGSRFGRAKVSFLSATPLDIRPVLEKIGTPAAVIAQLREVLVDEGRAVHGDVALSFTSRETLTEVAAQDTVAFTAPTTDPRIDRVVIDQATGVHSVVVGTEDSTPTAPAIPAGTVPVARVSLVVGMTEIADADITDERSLNLLGLGSAASSNAGTAAGDLVELVAGDRLPAIDGSLLTNLPDGADIVARANIVLNAFRIAVQGGLSVRNMVDGVVDEFEDETGVDTGTSTNETYDATTDCYHNPGGTTADLCTGGTASASNYDAGTPANAFDNATGNSSRIGYYGGTTTLPGHVQYDFGSGNAKTITKLRLYAIQSDSGNYGSVNGFTLQGSNDGSAWTDVYSGTHGENTGWEDFTFSNATAYRYYRVRVDTSWYSGRWSIDEIEMMGNLSPQDMTLASNAVTAEAQPDDAFVVLWEEDVDAITVNTDIKAWASRDNGTTWTQVMLAEEADLSTGRILTGSADISAQPLGTSMIWKVTTHNGKGLRLHGIGLEWS